MKVLDLRCEHGHGFEGWFASGDAFEDQLARGLVECPVCGTTTVVKLLAAPRLNLSGARAPAETVAGAGGGAPGAATSSPASADGFRAVTPSPNPQTRWMNAMRRLLANTENVGDRFAEEARKMHYGEVDERAIRGSATRAQAEALLDEGIEVVALPALPGAKDTLQ
jgi:hypothetical protein